MVTLLFVTCVHVLIKLWESAFPSLCQPHVKEDAESVLAQGLLPSSALAIGRRESDPEQTQEMWKDFTEI